MRSQLCLEHQKRERSTRSEGHLWRQTHDKRQSPSASGCLHTWLSVRLTPCLSQSLFQCLIGSCPQDAYGPAVAHVVLACSNLGMSIGPLHPVEIQHVNLEKPQYLPTPSMPAAYGTPSDPSQQGADHLTLTFDISIDLKCNSGSDGLVTVSLPPPVPSTSTTSTSSPSPAPNPGPGEGESEGESNNGESNKGENGNGENGKPTSTSPAEHTRATADPSAASSCTPDSVTSSAQDPGNGQAPSPSTDLGGQGNPAVTSESSLSSGRGGPASPASTSSCSTASDETGGLDPQDPNRSSPSSNSASEPSHPPNDGGEPRVSIPSSAILPAPASPTPALSSSTCSTTGGTEMSVNPVPDPQVSQTAKPATVAQPSPLPSPPSPPAATSLTEQAPTSTIHSIPPPPPPPPSDESADPSSVRPSEYAPLESGEKSSSKGSAFETSLPESSAEPLPQGSHSSGVQAPSYGQGGLSSPALASQTDALVAKTAESKPTHKIAEPSEITLWPTAKTNRTSCTTNPAGRGGPSTTICESDGKGTVTTAHTPRSNSPIPSDSVRDASPFGDTQQHESHGSVMVKIIRPGETNAETMILTIWETAPSATAVSTAAISSENGQASVAQLAIGSSLMVESMVVSSHDVEPNNSPTQTRFVTSRPTPAGFSVQSNGATAETSLPKVALVNSGSKSIPHLCTIALLIILVSGILMS